VELGGSAKAAPGGYPVGAVGFGPCWEDQPTLRELYDIACAAIVRQEAEADELRAEVAMLKQGMVILAEERDESRVQFRAAEALGMALVTTIDELKTEKADLFVQLVNLQAGSRRSTLDEIAESVREKYEPEYEREAMQND
jgi:cell division protein FtsB